MLTLEELHAHYVNKIAQDTFDYSDWNKLVVDYRTDVVAYLARFINLFGGFFQFLNHKFQTVGRSLQTEQQAFLRQEIEQESRAWFQRFVHGDKDELAGAQYQLQDGEQHDGKDVRFVLRDVSHVGNAQVGAE